MTDVGNLFGGFGGIMFSLLSSFFFWVIVLVFLLLMSIGMLFLRKKRKLQYPVLEFTDLGSGKMGIRKYKAGWFKTKSLFNLYDYGGEEILKLNDGRKVQSASSEDFHEIMGKRGLIVMRKPDDPLVLLPISKMEIKNKELMLEIAPADYRDTSVQIITGSERETLSKFEKYIPYVAFGFMGIIFLISIILIVQMVKTGQMEAKDLLLQVANKIGEYAGQVSEAP